MRAVLSCRDRKGPLHRGRFGMFVRRTGKPPVQQGYEKVLSQMMRNRREWQDKDNVLGGIEREWNPPKGIGEMNRAMDHAFAALFSGRSLGICPDRA